MTPSQVGRLRKRSSPLLSDASATHAADLYCLRTGLLCLVIRPNWGKGYGKLMKHERAQLGKGEVQKYDLPWEKECSQRGKTLSQ